MEEEVVKQWQSRRCLLEVAGPVGVVEEVGLGEQQSSARRSEEGAGGGDGEAEEEAGDLLW